MYIHESIRILPTMPCFSGDSPLFPSCKEATSALCSAPCSPWLHPPGTPPSTQLSTNFPSVGKGGGRISSHPRCSKYSLALKCTSSTFPRNTPPTSQTTWFYLRQERAQLKVKNRRMKNSALSHSNPQIAGAMEGKESRFPFPTYHSSEFK